MSAVRSAAHPPALPHGDRTIAGTRRPYGAFMAGQRTRPVRTTEGRPPCARPLLTKLNEPSLLTPARCEAPYHRESRDILQSEPLASLGGRLRCGFRLPGEVSRA